MSLEEVYDLYKIKDRIKTGRKILFVCPEKGYDVSKISEEFLLDPIEYEITWPKAHKKAQYDIMMAEMAEYSSKLAIQVDCNLTKKLPYWRDGEMSSGLSERIKNTRGDLFVNLHHHDEFSVRDGLGKVSELVELLKERGNPFCPITNHGGIGGWIRQYNACKKAGVKAIFGMEAYVANYRGDDPEQKKLHRKNNHLIVLAKTMEGFNNIIRMHNDAQLNGFYYSPRVNYEGLKKYGKGVIGSSSCFAGEIPQALAEGDKQKAIEAYERYKDAFDEFYIELEMIEWSQQTGMNQLLIEFAQEVGAELTVSLDSHYLYPEYGDTHDILLLIRDRKTIIDKKETPEEVWQFDVRNLYYRTEDEVRELWAEGFDSEDENGDLQHYEYKTNIFTEEVLNRAIENTRRIALKCEDIELDSTFKLPHLYKDAAKELRAKATEGLRKRGLHGIKKYEERLEFELGVIVDLGFEDYFLVVEKIVNDTKDKFGEFSVGYGRGCFTPDSRVITSNGIPKFIADVKKGDKVIADDGSTQTVEEAFEYDVDEELIEIEIDDGRKFRCTKEHEILINESGNRVWKKAKDLKEGDDVVDVTEHRLGGKSGNS